MLFWIWIIPAGIVFCLLGLMVLWAALANAQSGEPFYGFLTFVLGIPTVAVLAAVWPIWFPFTFTSDIKKDLRKKAGKA
ncbi:hypothetical protein SEA_BILLNYE_152 [Streptomyces phage BillNye]|uniref:Uncharacterized protein n=2 Tax=Wilnyevirus billnye TaxID=2560486 RepID=A0A2L1IVY8_9CAUD|nr:hypothetical protein FDJ30_gp108 [Streptomyces phage BillNye]AVD99325.1 hypothetical protein SEA_BILLNYE_152 [Streptomyces phage BillNye]QBZ72408.1 hypothetical protein SEA_CIRCINUS_153 [Streptomyces phage Circinus]